MASPYTTRRSLSYTSFSNIVYTVVIVIILIIYIGIYLFLQALYHERNSIGRFDASQYFRTRIQSAEKGLMHLKRNINQLDNAINIASTSLRFIPMNHGESYEIGNRYLVSNKSYSILEYSQRYDKEYPITPSSCPLFSSIVNRSAIKLREEAAQRIEMTSNVSSKTNQTIALYDQDSQDKTHMNRVFFLLNSSISQAALYQSYKSLESKIKCIHGRQGGVYLYHIRKAAGTSLRDFLTLNMRRIRGPRIIETEGPVLDSEILSFEGYLSIISLRHPIERIESMYWYEHVAWYINLKKTPHKVLPFRQYIDAWRDGAEWKSFFLSKNPGSVYIEVENYYVKALSGWIGPEPVSKKHLYQAMNVLNQFNIILITEWFDFKRIQSKNNTQGQGYSHLTDRHLHYHDNPIDLRGDMTKLQLFMLDTIFRGKDKKYSIAAQHKTAGNSSLISNASLHSQLIPDKESIYEYLYSLNRYDMQLYWYARSLAIGRLFYIQRYLPMIQQTMNELSPPIVKRSFRSRYSYTKPPPLPGCGRGEDHAKDSQWKNKIGIYRPPYHKGPLNITKILLNISDDPPVPTKKPTRISRYIVRNKNYINGIKTEPKLQHRVADSKHSSSTDKKRIEQERQAAIQRAREVLQQRRKSASQKSLLNPFM